MGSGKLSFTFISVLTFGASFLTHQLADCRDLRREVVCFDDVLRLDCGNRSIIAVHEAYYTTDVTDNVTCQTETSGDDEVHRGPRNYSSCDEDIRISVNRICSGNKFCDYTYSKEPENERLCTSEGGVLVVRYDCVRESSIVNYCNIKLHQKEGYISSPGYPQYYMKLAACEWGIEALEGQTILLKVLHLQTRPASAILGPSSLPFLDQETQYALGHLPAYSEPLTKCDNDILTVLEGNVERLTACGESLQALQQPIEAEGSNGLAIRFKSMDLAPFSGFLAYFKVHGCPNLAASEGSYLLERNGSAAVYACYNQNVFNDTLENTRFVQCVRDHHWNDTLPPCIAEKVIEDTTTIIPNKNIQVEEVENFTTQNIDITSSASVQLAPSFLEDILIPSILIGVLLVGNAVILIIIIIIRRRQKAKSKEEDEEFEEQKPPNPVNDAVFTTV